MNYADILDRLTVIEGDLAERQTEYEAAAEEKHRVVRDYELRLAQAFMAARGDTATERKSQALVAIAAAEGGLYTRMTEAEARFEGLKAAIRVLDQRAMIGMSLAKAFTREAGPQPSWSGT